MLWGNLGIVHIPQKLNLLNGVINISAGRFHSLFLKKDSTVWACGGNLGGQLGNGGNHNDSIPIIVSGLTRIKAISGGGSHSLFLKNDSTVWAIGYNWNGQLGDSTNTIRYSPVKVKGLSNVIAISAGVYHSIFLRDDSTVWVCGENYWGQLGIGTSDTSSHRMPVKVPGLSGVIAISAGGFHSLFLKRDSTVWACGSNASGELGDGTFAPQRNSPVLVSNLNGIVFISGGEQHSLFLRSDNTLWACGTNTHGELGDGTFVAKSIPVNVVGSCYTGVEENSFLSELINIYPNVLIICKTCYFI